jgi:hypothetical protein
MHGGAKPNNKRMNRRYCALAVGVAEGSPPRSIRPPFSLPFRRKD